MAPLEGPVGIGALVDATMLGCVIVQSCVYYKNSRGDAWWLRVLVSCLLPYEPARSHERNELIEIPQGIIDSVSQRRLRS